MESSIRGRFAEKFSSLLIRAASRIGSRLRKVEVMFERLRPSQARLATRKSAPEAGAKSSSMIGLSQVVREVHRCWESGSMEWEQPVEAFIRGWNRRMSVEEATSELAGFP